MEQGRTVGGGRDLELDVGGGQRGRVPFQIDLEREPFVLPDHVKSEARIGLGVVGDADQDRTGGGEPTHPHILHVGAMIDGPDASGAIHEPHSHDVVPRRDRDVRRERQHVTAIVRQLDLTHRDLLTGEVVHGHMECGLAGLNA